MSEAPRSPIKHIKHPVNPRIQTFLDEISVVHEEIFNRHGLELIPSLEILNSGINPVWAVVVIDDSKKVIKKKGKK